MFSFISRFRFRLALVMVCASLALSAQAETVLRLGTTTSMQSSGLLDILLDAFAARSGVMTHAAIQGSGQAMRNAANGNSDVILTHAPKAERQFVAEGDGIKRHLLMYNEFVIVGPETDPAGIHSMSDAAHALAQIASKQQLFISRGDNSGTHVKEQQIWQQAALTPDSKRHRWYRQTGSGMGASLRVAYEKNAYILIDWASWLKQKRHAPHFTIHVRSDPRLVNQYSVIAVNPAKHPHVNHLLARQFIEFLMSADGQSLIDHARIKDERLFRLGAGPQSSVR